MGAIIFDCPIQGVVHVFPAFKGMINIQGKRPVVCNWLITYNRALLLFVN